MWLGLVDVLQLPDVCELPHMEVRAGKSGSSRAVLLASSQPLDDRSKTRPPKQAAQAVQLRPARGACSLRQPFEGLSSRSRAAGQ